MHYENLLREGLDGFGAQAAGHPRRQLAAEP